MPRKKSTISSFHKKRKNAATSVPLNIPVELIPVPEAADLFEERKREVQTMIAEMVLRGRGKRSARKIPSSPSAKEMKPKS